MFAACWTIIVRRYLGQRPRSLSYTFRENAELCFAEKLALLSFGSATSPSAWARARAFSLAGFTAQVNFAAYALSYFYDFLIDHVRAQIYFEQVRLF